MQLMASARLRRLVGTLRSICIYWRPGRQRGLRQLYSGFVREGDLVFDVGAHVGDRTVAFAGLGARVVALEPQPQLLPVLRRVTRKLCRVTILTSAVGRETGEAELLLSAATPTVSTLSTDWVDSVKRDNQGFRGVAWDERVTVPVTTLDALIAQYGAPVFCKIDVEGFEAEVLAGLSRPIPAVSFEFVPGAEGVATDCITRLEALGRYEYNVVRGEQRQFLLAQWCDAVAMNQWLKEQASGGSGDVYARLATA